MSIHSSTFDDMGYFIPPIPVPLTPTARKSNFLRRLALTRKIINNPLEVFAKPHFEEPVSISKVNVSQNIIINDVDFIRHCFVENAGNYKLSFIRKNLLKPALRDGLLTVEGEQWKNSRKAMAPVFAPRNVDNFAETMKQTCLDFVSKIDKTSKVQSLSYLMSELTYLILSETLFSGDINEDVENVLKEVSYLLEYMGKPDVLDFIRAPMWIPRVSKLPGRYSIYKFRQVVEKNIKKRKARIEQGEDVPEDFLTLLLKTEADGNRLTVQEVVDNILTFIAAGHETTARATTWNIYLLSKSRKFRDLVFEEVNALDMDNVPAKDWAQHLPWTTAAFEEAMRIYPPAGIVTRSAVEDDDFKGVHIAKDSQIVLAPWILHRHKTLWDHPERFDPERFYGENRRKIHRFAYLPFGVGPRVCIGARFSMMEGVIIMAILMKHLSFEYASKAPPWPVLKITLQTDNGMPMRISPVA